MSARVGNRFGPSSAEERFWARVARSEDCWLWTGAVRRPQGYGWFRSEGARWYAHRYSWLLHQGPVPARLYVCHRCDVRLCVRPDHLFLGTHLDNVRDMVAKGRRRGGVCTDKTISRLPKLSVEKAKEIRAAFTGAWGDVARLARSYGVSASSVSAIVQGRNYRHG